jgi:hypothetical protein
MDKGNEEIDLAASPKGEWTDNAQRLGEALRRGYNRWLSD